MKKFHIITIFPEVIGPYATASILGRAQSKKLAEVIAHDLRSFSTDKHRKVDDAPYGGGAGMVMTVQPFADAIKAIKKSAKKRSVCIVVTSASGQRFTEADAVRLSAYDELVFLCGRYEGIDQRVIDNLADESLSIGDYVLTGGELPALVMTDAIIRLIPGVLGNAETLAEESHTVEGVLEYPQYTKPETYILKVGRKTTNLVVPPVLLSGNHAAIKKWRALQAKIAPKKEA